MSPFDSQPHFISVSEPFLMCKPDSCLLENRSDFRYAKKRSLPPSKIVPISATKKRPRSGILKKFRPQRNFLLTEQ